MTVASSVENRGGPIVAINVTPLVDVVLVLLVVLMVTAGYLVSRAIPVDLPKAKSGETTTTTLALTLDRRGQLFIDGSRASLAELGQRADQLARENSDTRALLAADGHTEHRQVIEVVDVLRRHGISRFALNVDPSMVEHERR